MSSTNHTYVLAPIKTRALYGDHDVQVCTTCGCEYHPASGLHVRSGMNFGHPIQCIDEEIENLKTID